MGLSAIGGLSSHGIGGISPVKKEDEEEKKKLLGSNQNIAYSKPILSFPPSTDASAIRGRGESFNAIG